MLWCLCLIIWRRNIISFSNPSSIAYQKKFTSYYIFYCLWPQIKYGLFAVFDPHMTALYTVCAKTILTNQPEQHFRRIFFLFDYANFMQILLDCMGLRASDFWHKLLHNYIVLMLQSLYRVREFKLIQSKYILYINYQAYGCIIKYKK